MFLTPCIYSLIFSHVPSGIAINKKSDYVISWLRACWNPKQNKTLKNFPRLWWNKPSIVPHAFFPTKGKLKIKWSGFVRLHTCSWVYLLCNI